MHIRVKMDIPGANDEILDELFEKFHEIDFFYGDTNVRFYGDSERLQEFLRALAAYGLKTEPKPFNF